MTTSATPTAALVDQPTPPATGAGTILHPMALPALGAMWMGQGGIFAGIVRGAPGEPGHALIVAAEDLPAGAWGERGKDVPGAASHHDSMANTLAMVEAGSEIAKACREYTADGHTDFCLPSQADLQVAAANVRELFDTSDWYWTSTQDGRNYAYVQDFADGYSSWTSKAIDYRVRAVRRIQLQHVSA